MRFGYLLPTFEDHSMVELGIQAESMGFDSVWVPDSPLVYRLPDPLVVLGGLAAVTSRVTLGTGVLLGALREPVLLAHSLATLARSVPGRLVVGLGSGFGSPESERQFAAVGVPFRGRVGRLTELVSVLRALWSGETVRHRGRYFAFDDVTLQAVAPPPVWLAGAGESAERRVGRVGDGWLPYLRTPELYAAGWDRVRAAADDAGRAEPEAALYLTVALDRDVDAAQQRLRTTVERWYGRPFEVVSGFQATFAGTPAGLQQWLEPYRRVGVRHVVLRSADDDPRRGLEALTSTVAA